MKSDVAFLYLCFKNIFNMSVWGAQARVRPYAFAWFNMWRTQALEDVIVLAFLEHDLVDFANLHPEYSEGKFVDILRKSYLKMSPKGREAVLTLIQLPKDLVPLIQKAIA